MFSTITKKYVDAAIRFRRNEVGATAVEYGLIVGLIAIVIIAGVTALGGSLNGMFGNISDTLDGVPGVGAGD